MIGKFVLGAAALVASVEAHGYLSDPLSRLGARTGTAPRKVFPAQLSLSDTTLLQYRFDQGFGTNNAYPYSAATLNTCGADDDAVGYRAPVRILAPSIIS
jgi:hypothetical protein